MCLVPPILHHGAGLKGGFSNISDLIVASDGRGSGEQRKAEARNRGTCGRSQNTFFIFFCFSKAALSPRERGSITGWAQLQMGFSQVRPALQPIRRGIFDLGNVGRHVFSQFCLKRERSPVTITDCRVTALHGKFQAITQIELLALCFVFSFLI